MSLETKIEKLKQIKSYNDHNSERIRIDPNIQYEFILPSNWADLIEQKNRDGIDSKTGSPRSYVETTFKVLDPQAEDQSRARSLACGESLANKIQEELMPLLVQGEGGEIRLTLMKEMKGNNTFGEWKVRARPV